MAAVASAFAAPAAAQDRQDPRAPPAAGACAGVRALERPDLLIKTAEAQAAGSVTLSFGPASLQLPAPAHCLVRGVLNPRKGVGGREFGIGFELRLPEAWNGRFLFQGGGGLDGVIRPALGLSFGGPTALARGFAVVSTDAGHQGEDASFAADQQARLDYAYQALGKVAEQAKAIIVRYYGAPARFSYFDGCSNGGRQGFIAAQRYPTMFDGIVAGAPGFRLSRAAVAETWDNVQFSRVAPRDAEGRPIFAKSFSDAELALVAQAILRRCDDADGLADGFVNNVKACRFDPAELQCAKKQTKLCLSRQKVQALAAVYRGAKDSTGRSLYSDWAYDPGLASPDWRNWKLGRSETGEPNGANQTLGRDALGRYFATPPLQHVPMDRFDFDRAEAIVAETGALNDATSTFLTSFKAHGGKLLVYHGMADPIFSAKDTMAWFGRLDVTMGGADDFARLFLVPGMNHCAGGVATDRFDALSAIQAWVEEGRAPEALIAAQMSAGSPAGPPPQPVRTRPLCPFPKYARYKSGDPNKAESFVCAADPPARNAKLTAAGGLM